MTNFRDLNLNPPLFKALEDLGFTRPTPIQKQAFNVISSGKDVIGIAQTGTGKTFAFLLPILKNLTYSKQENPRVLILVPTRELVIQIVNAIDKLTKYSKYRILGVYGGTNINTQKHAIANGVDIVIATPGRLYDLALSRVLQLKSIQKLVIDEVDVMLDLGFRPQLLNIFDILPKRRQNIMFSATMTNDIDRIINDFFIAPSKISIAVSGTPLENIKQSKYNIPNFYTKLNLLIYLLEEKEKFNKVLIFVALKKIADRLFEALKENFNHQLSVIHSNKTQNYRLRSIEKFRTGNHRILIATDIMARGLDIANISQVINFDTPVFPENYIHRIGRTGRAKKKGESIIFFTKKEQESIKKIEDLMNKKISEQILPEVVEISKTLIEEEQAHPKERNNPIKRKNISQTSAAFHEKSEKNSKKNLGGSYKFKIAAKYKKPKTRGDKNYNKKKKNK